MTPRLCSGHLPTRLAARTNFLEPCRPGRLSQGSHVNKLTLNPLHYSVTRVDGLRDEVERDFRLTLMQFGHGTPGQAASSLQPVTQLGARITSLIPSETKSCSFLHMKIDAPVTSMIVPVLVPQLV